MDRDFIPYEESVAIKETGFNLKCMKGFYGKEELFTVVTTPVDFNNKKSLEPLISCPLYQQAFRWIRENYKLWHFITPYKDEEDGDIVKYGYDIITDDDDINEEQTEEEGFSSYEEAELVCLQEMIKLIKSLKDEEDNHNG